MFGDFLKRMEADTQNEHGGTIEIGDSGGNKHEINQKDTRRCNE